MRTVHHLSGKKIEDFYAAYLHKEDPQETLLIDEMGDQQRTPQPGRCYKGDDVAAWIELDTSGSSVTPATSVDGATLFVRFKIGTVGSGNNLVGFSSSPRSPLNDLYFKAGGFVTFFVIDVGQIDSNTGSLDDGKWHSLALTYNWTSKELILYVDGVWDKTVDVTATAATIFRATAWLSWTSGNRIADHKTFDMRIFNAVKSDAQILDIHNFKYDTENIWRWMKGDEGAGSDALDSSGNGFDAEIKNLYSGFHDETENDLYSFQNEIGYNESAGVMIPRDESDPDNDVLGNALVNIGRIRYDGLLEESSCGFFDGLHGAACASSYIAAADPEEVIRWEFSYSGFASNAAHQVVFGHSAGNTSIGFNNNFLNINFGSDWGYQTAPAEGRVVVEYNRTTEEINVSLYDLAGDLVSSTDDNQPVTGTFEFDRIGSRNGSNYLDEVKLWDLRIYKDDVLTDHWMTSDCYGDLLYNRISSRHATLSGHSRATFWGQTQNYFPGNLLYGFSLYEHATDPAIRVPLVITAPTGYTKTGDYPAGRWFNTCETKVDFTTGEPFSPWAQKLLAHDPDMDEYTHGHALTDPLHKLSTEDKERKFIFKKI